MTKAVTFIPIGGLGNQLFIYGAGRSLAHLLDCQLEIDKSFLCTTSAQASAGFTQRSYHLGDLIGATGVSEVWLNTHVRHQFAIRRRRIVRYPVPRTTRRFRSTFVEDEARRFDGRLFECEPGTLAFGYFQSWKYLTPVEDQLRSELNNLRRPTTWFSRMRDQIESTRGAIGVHIRRGDYPDPIKYEYYRRSLRLAEDLGGQHSIFLFSDDPDGSQALLNQMGVDGQLIDPAQDSPDIESLLLLSKCDVIITANSTFSWWAGWLAEKPDAVVIAPRPWHFGSSTADADLIPPNWITIGR